MGCGPKNDRPQRRQAALLPLFSVPQAGQFTTSRAPQFAQNRASSGLDDLHLPHFMDPRPRLSSRMEAYYGFGVQPRRD
jgi:hypothetical protein